MSKNIRSKAVKESLLNYNSLAKSLTENTEGAIKALLSEQVRDTYAKLLAEADDEDYEEEEVEDTETDTDDMPNEVDADPADVTGGDDAGMEADELDDVDGEEDDVDLDVDSDDEIDGFEDTEDDMDDDVADQGGEWGDFDKYKVSDGEYDFSDAEDEEIVKVYKLMKDDDQVMVHKGDDGKMSIKDNETGAEYLLDLGPSEPSGASMNEPTGTETETEFELELDGEDEFGDEDDTMESDLETDDKDMTKTNESHERLFELVLEYDSNVGYTDNYQKKDVMTNPGMTEPGKNVNDWDAGVPKGSSKPWSGKKDKANKPFDGEKGKKVEEAIEGLDSGASEPVEECGDTLDELKTVQQHTANIGSTSRTDGPETSRRRKGRSFHTAKNGQVTTTSDNAYGTQAEALMRRMNKALKENKDLKGRLGDVITMLKEAAVTNHNLAQIIKLISENTTSYDEKAEIVERFKKEAKTIQASKNLYESINRDLKKSNKMSITEDRGMKMATRNKINETTIYKSKDMLDSLDLMHRMMK